MCLNIITDLCRLLSQGYSHLYRVFKIIRMSLLPSVVPITSEIVGDVSGVEDSFPMTLYDYITRLFEADATHDRENQSSLGQLRYLQGLQKLVYLMIIDDYMTVFLFSFGRK